ncbi:MULTISPECIES: hypothetical protein [unclassified Streptomyces]|uniref:hypothetical protein n=1 Tax=unclassified Streptomyces TaxID=2593676 RepID=UPI00296779D6|nr:hypothetical protein [Streptomyces sp. SJL17-1]
MGDGVYDTFVEGFRSIAADLPRNTLLVYSFDLLAGAERVHGKDFADFLEKSYEPVDREQGCAPRPGGGVDPAGARGVGGLGGPGPTSYL